MRGDLLGGMATFQGVLVRTTATPVLLQTLSVLGVVAMGSPPKTGGFFIEVGGWTRSRAEALARRVSELIEADVLAISGQTNADVYTIAEFSRGRVVRQIQFNRDGGGWVDAEGPPRPWESDLHFAGSMERYLDVLTDDDAPETELTAARLAYERRDLARLPRLPAPSGSSMGRFLESLGGDFSRPHARHRAPGLLARLFGRG